MTTPPIRRQRKLTTDWHVVFFVLLVFILIIIHLLESIFGINYFTGMVNFR